MYKLNEVLDIFSERLQELMAEKHLNIKDLSSVIKIPRSTINSWTLKKRSPKIDYLCTVAHFFGVTTDYLLGLED